MRAVMDDFGGARAEVGEIVVLQCRGHGPGRRDWRAPCARVPSHLIASRPKRAGLRSYRHVITVIEIESCDVARRLGDPSILVDAKHARDMPGWSLPLQPMLGTGPKNGS